MKQQIDYKQYLASREWRLKRKEVIEDRGGICERCASRPIQDVHHLTYERIGDEDPKADLLGVCRPCHEYLAAERDDDPALDSIIEAVGDGLFAVKDWDKKTDSTQIAFIGGESDYGFSLKVRFVSNGEQMIYDSWLPRVEIGPGAMAIFSWV